MNTAAPGPVGSDEAGPLEDHALHASPEDDPPEPAVAAPFDVDADDDTSGIWVYAETIPVAVDDTCWLLEKLEHAVQLIDRSVERFAVRVVDDARMTDLHRRYMGIDETTDVLTFPADEDESDVIDVDVAVCVDEASRQAQQRGHDVRHELLLYAVHALLHCAGFDDVDEAGAAAMHAREDEILRAIGVGEVFDRGARP